MGKKQIRSQKNLERMMKMDQTKLETVVNYLSNLKFEEIPPEVIEKAKLCMLDTLGVALAGSVTSTGKAAKDFALSIGGNKDATLYNYGNQVSWTSAAYANGTMAFCYNFTDTTLSCVVHCGPVVVPTALSVAEKMGNSGKDFLVAVIAGYEMMNRVGNAINSGRARMSHHKRGFHATGTTGVFGAASTAAKLLGLSQDQTMNALGIAGSYASGLLESCTTPKSDVWKSHPGIAGQNGISAVLLARFGLKGPYTVLEGKDGFFTAFGGGNFDLGKMEEDLGKRLLIMDTAFKLHNGPHVWANPLDSLGRMIKTHGLKPEDVDGITIMIPTMYTYVMHSSRNKYPNDAEDAESDPRYLMAAMMLHGRVYVEQFADRVLHNPKMKEMTGRVTLEVDPSLDKVFQETDKTPARVRVKMKGKKEELTETADHPRGAPKNPATNEELENKFLALAGGVLEKGKALAIAQMVGKLEKLDNLRDFVGLLIA